MDTFEGGSENLEVNSLVYFEPVKICVVLGETRTRVEVEYCSESKVLDSLKFCLV
jgi:hypothetical protein